MITKTSNACRPLIERIEDAGHAFRVTEEGRLRVTHASELSDADREAIRAARDDLVSWLSPDPKAGAEAAEDARVLAGILDADPGISLDDIRDRAAAEGIEGPRFAHGLAALPLRYDAGPTPRSPKEKLDEFLEDQPKPAGKIAEEVLDELKSKKEPLPQDLKKWPSGPRYVCALLARRGMSRGRAVELVRRWWLLGADLRAAEAMGWDDAAAILKDAGVKGKGAAR